MRSRTKWRDRVKEASKKLKVILKNSSKLSVSTEDLGRLKGATRLQEACDEGRQSESWLFYGTLGSGFLVILLLIFLVSGALQDTCAPSNTTKDIQIQTIRIERLPLDGSLEATEDTTLYNDSEDGEDGRLRGPPHLRLRRGR